MRSSIKLGCWLFLCLLYPRCAAAQGEGNRIPADLDIYLCIGQSNMAGRGALTPEVTDTLRDVYLLDDRGCFGPAVNPLNRYSTIRKELSMQGLGPSYAFAREMVRVRNRPVGLVVNARGGSSIDSWLKGSADGYYEEALARVRIALQQGGSLKAILWHQGESDCSDPEAYQEKLIAMVRSFRADLGMPELLVIVGELSRWNWTGTPEGTAPFNRMIRNIASFLPHSDWVSSEGADPHQDETDPHFGTRGQLLLGKRYAEKVLKFCGRSGCNPIRRPGPDIGPAAVPVTGARKFSPGR